MATSDEKTQENVLRGVLARAADMKLDQPPPVMGQQIHRVIKKLTGNNDPYFKIKDSFNRYALKLYPECKKIIEQSSSPFETVVRLTAAGNAIDFGASTEVEQPDASTFIEHALSEQLVGNVKPLQDAVCSAQSILYLGDNSGEIVFDRLLIERLPMEKVTFAVRGSPIINDATMSDAKSVGITDLVKVIENGSDAPGTIIEECSDIFRRHFDAADLLISKGQGNYETLSDVEKKIFFIVKAKCQVIAKHIGCKHGSLVVKGKG
eukprot:CAMPEP_0201283406 /NCGR_PEP_ID=MMETSP1317-20130820/8462_1 /ASSEMBLY_ACC=CAM_ASM_000770 /TAXON_ID=187299 /ORGANISM="Undescribed Undescribed, Strain Undescribed" /LENGTH=263 /DNA_ID=CAMNT_0047599533 /DNA_START=1281 /DNA_END=2072 /DNA_ORIENTATION=-